MKAVLLLVFGAFLIGCNTSTSEPDNGDRTSDEKKEKVQALTTEPQSIELFSEQFKWTARYAGSNNKLGKFDYKVTTDLNPLALLTPAAIDYTILLLEEDLSAFEERSVALNNGYRYQMELERIQKNERILSLLKAEKKRQGKKGSKIGLDDFIVSDTLCLLSGQEYEFSFRSKDVIHTAYFPHFNSQSQAVPGMTTRVKITPSLTTAKMRRKKNDPNFNYILLCNKICGKDHYKMKMVVLVVEEDEYFSWIKHKQKKPFKKANQKMIKQIQRLEFEKDAASR